MPLTEQDLTLLSSYIDGQLTPGERASLEARLAQDADLSAELDSLWATVGLLRMAERLQVPRSFTLDPNVYGRPQRASFWGRFRLSALSPLASAGAAIAVLMILGGGLVLATSFVGAGSPAARAPAGLSVAQGGAAELAPAATQAPTEAATEEIMTAGGPATEAADNAAATPASLGPAPTQGYGGAGGLAPQATTQLPSVPGNTQRYGTNPATENMTAAQAAPKAAELPERTPTPELAAAPSSGTGATPPQPPVLAIPLVPVLGGVLVLAGAVVLVAILTRRR